MSPCIFWTDILIANYRLWCHPVYFVQTFDSWCVMIYDKWRVRSNFWQSSSINPLLDQNLYHYTLGRIDFLMHLALGVVQQIYMLYLSDQMWPQKREGVRRMFGRVKESPKLSLTQSNSALPVLIIAMLMQLSVVVVVVNGLLTFIKLWWLIMS